MEQREARAIYDRLRYEESATVSPLVTSCPECRTTLKTAHGSTWGLWAKEDRRYCPDCGWSRKLEVVKK